ncbi:hypothetical protein GNP80_08925 [Aliivibrio fischeri]|uniref:hypothetical protein n=1 Tax=Aliivibrio fischeri TaxID=668 RepID=UPI0012D8FF39|nr:hypothetical protein [Aliivibrio fischeri]MUK92564.1 hypothetical protein [Aliivibrio fischeri]
MSIANQLVKEFFVCEVTAFESVVSKCSNMAEHDGYSVYRFDDNSSLKLFISDDHEFFATEI